MVEKLFKIYLNFDFPEGFSLSANSKHYSNTAEAAIRGVLQTKVFLEILQNSQESTSARVSFLIKLHRCFPVNFEKFLRTPFSQTAASDTADSTNLIKEAINPYVGKVGSCLKLSGV